MTSPVVPAERDFHLNRILQTAQEIEGGIYSPRCEDIRESARILAAVAERPATCAYCAVAIDGAPPSQPADEAQAFEQLCREHEIAGTAAARQCEVFWRAGARFSSQPVALTEPIPTIADVLEWAAGMATHEDPRKGDWYYDDPHELAKAIRKGPEGWQEEMLSAATERPRNALLALSHMMDDEAQGITEGRVYEFATQIRVLLGLDGEEAAQLAAAPSRSPEAGKPIGYRAVWRSESDYVWHSSRVVREHKDADSIVKQWLAQKMPECFAYEVEALYTHPSAADGAREADAQVISDGQIDALIPHPTTIYCSHEEEIDWYRPAQMRAFARAILALRVAPVASQPTPQEPVWQALHECAKSLDKLTDAIAEHLAATPQSEQPDSEREQLRAEQAAKVMPQIGPLLDAWEGADNDTKGTMREFAPELVRHLVAINQAMEGEPVSAPSGVETPAAHSGERDA